MFVAYNIILSVVRQDTKKPDFWRNLTYIFHKLVGGRDTFAPVSMGCYGTVSKTFLLKIVQKNLLRGWVGGGLKRINPLFLLKYFYNSDFSTCFDKM